MIAMIALALALLAPAQAARMLAERASLPARALLEAVPSSFMQALPLRVDFATPALLAADGAPVTLSGSDAIQVVFSRPVIALGSDFGLASAVPFTLSPPVEGAFRWVTSYVVRFDPAGTWGSDLNLTLSWDLDLRSWDGIPLLPAGLQVRARVCAVAHFPQPARACQACARGERKRAAQGGLRARSWAERGARTASRGARHSSHPQYRGPAGSSTPNASLWCCPRSLSPTGGRQLLRQACKRPVAHAMQPIAWLAARPVHCASVRPS